MAACKTSEEWCGDNGLRLGRETRYDHVLQACEEVAGVFDLVCGPEKGALGCF